jgi:ankyrin repeat protein
MLAADDDHSDTVAVLLAHGADAAAKNSDGETALVIAESWENEDTVEVLKQAAAGK